MLKVVESDLLDQDVEVIVNAWNRNIIPWRLLVSHGVSGAIKRRGGYQPFRELGRHGAIPLGEAVETGPGRLPFKAIIHVAGINVLVSNGILDPAIREECLGIGATQGVRIHCISAYRRWRWRLSAGESHGIHEGRSGKFWLRRRGAYRQVHRQTMRLAVKYFK